MEEKQCKRCQQILPLSSFYKSYTTKDKHSPKCKPCECEHRREKRAMGLGRPKKQRWVRTNKNHYPDSEWVWTQLENGITGTKLYEKIDKKYALSDHGNLGKSHKKHKPHKRYGG